MNCTDCELDLSNYVEGTLDAGRSESIDKHLSSCTSCSELIADLRGVLEWSGSFPSHPAPEWLAGRIVASTPTRIRESWSDTLIHGWKWVSAPRMAMTVFASVLVLGWTANTFGISTNPAALVRDPAAAYYDAEGFVYDTYDGAVRFWYRSRIATELYCRIEQLREIA